MSLVTVCRLYDIPDSDLIKHWEKTYKFIKEAKYVQLTSSSVLAHSCVVICLFVSCCITTKISKAYLRLWEGCGLLESSPMMKGDQTVV